MLKNEKRFDLTGKVAIVTGGTGILGRHFCTGLAQAGAKVAVLDIDEKSSNIFAQELMQKYETETLGVGCDISNPVDVQSKVGLIIEKWNCIDILHNNAATKTHNLKNFFTAFEDYSWETWQEVMNVNLGGYFLMAQAVGKQMCKQVNGGSIIQTASIYGILAPDQRIYQGSEYQGIEINTPAVYSASKAGVIGLTQYLSSYWGEKSIRVNTLTPGGVESGQNTVFNQNYSKRVPLGRMAKAGDLVGALLFLASDDSSYITGQNIVVDGGLSVW
jgi:NAD(P)-dependent dehydrogenase (short-subunit alcohol dehydrogenase family)